MKKLDSLVDFFVEGRTNDTVSAKEKKLLKEALVNEVLQEVKANLTQAEKDALKKSLEQERKELRRGSIAELILDAVVLAFLVGLAVNQLTNIFDQLRLGVGIGVLRWAVVSLIFLAILVIVFLFVKMGIQFVKKSDTDDM